jgi:hypothetical protein
MITASFASYFLQTANPLGITCNSMDIITSGCLLVGKLQIMAELPMYQRTFQAKTDEVAKGCNKNGHKNSPFTAFHIQPLSEVELVNAEGGLVYL